MELLLENKALICLEADSVDSWGDLAQGLRGQINQFELIEISSVYSVLESNPGIEKKHPKQHFLRFGSNSGVLNQREGHLVTACSFFSGASALEFYRLSVAAAADASQGLCRVELLLFNSEFMSTPNLTLPSPDLHKLEKFLVPATDIWPEAIHPILDVTLQEILKQKPQRPWGEFFAQGKTLLDFSKAAQ